MMSNIPPELEGYDMDDIEKTSGDLMANMIRQFEELGTREDYDQVIEGVMIQLLSKELIHEPARLLCERYPVWLVNNKGKMTPTEYENYGKQYQALQFLVDIYETDPENYPRIMELLFDIQQFRLPPAEIIKDIAPGLKFDDNGSPMMPNMGPGMMPNVNGDVPPLANIQEQLSQGNCTLM